jgi:hypothetical protein
VDVSHPRPYAEAPANAPTGVAGGSFCAQLAEDPVVVFLVGMRINRLRRPWSWWSTFLAMPRMVRELEDGPDRGFLGARTFWSGRVFLVVQYWRSLEALGAYARASDLQHAPMWRRFNGGIAATADVGVFHETYLVDASRAETLYGNMPVFGLAAATEHVPRSQRRRSPTVERLGQVDPQFVPTAGSGPAA